MNANQPIRPLSIGNVVSAGFRLYNDNRGRYLKLSLQATAWTMLMLGGFALCVGLMVMGGVLMAGASGTGSESGGGMAMLGFGFLLLLPMIPLALFCIVKIVYCENLIAANAYGYLSDMVETVRETHDRLKKKMWNFWVIRFLVGCILSVANIAGNIIQQVASILMELGRQNNFLISIGLGILLLAVLATWAVQLWLTARLFIPDVTLALEPEVKTVNTIGRSWSLTQGHAIRIMSILFVAGLITLPLYLVAIVPALITLFATISGGVWLEMSKPNPNGAALGSFFLGLGLATLVYLVLLQVANVLAMPFWQTIKSVVYYDLRNRREGLGLRLE
jgi:MFS family permease